MKKHKCRYCQKPITDESPSYYNCGCRTKPSPTTVSVEVVLEHQRFKQALEEIAYHVSTPIGEEENFEKTVYEFVDTAKRALGY